VSIQTGAQADDVVDIEVDIRTIPGDSEDEVRRHLDKALGDLSEEVATAEAMAGRFHGNDELALTTQAWLDTCELFLG